MFNHIRSTFWKSLNYLVSPQAASLFGEPLFRFLNRGYNDKNTVPLLSAIKQILVVRLDEIGDLVLTTPFIRELRRNAPHAYITLVVKPELYNLMELCPYTNEILTYNWKTYGRFSQQRRHCRAIIFAWKYLWSRHFTLAIIPRWDIDYYHATYVSYFSGATHRVGYSEKVTDSKKKWNKGFDKLLTIVINDHSLKHEVEHNLYMIEFIGGNIYENHLENWLSKEDEEFANTIIDAKERDANNFFIAFAPGAGANKRKWPISNFIEIGRWLTDEYHALIIVVGGPEDESLGLELNNRLKDMIIDLTGKATLRQTTAVLKRCRLFVGNDSGPMHLAAAVGIPVVEISAHPQNALHTESDSPARFRPWGVPNKVVQPLTTLFPCNGICMAEEAHCINSVSVENVQNSITKIIAEQMIL